jgi:GntR family transcriptional regulator
MFYSNRADRRCGVVILDVEPDGEIPIYQQLRDRIVEAIARGDITVGDSLPTTRQLAIDLGINMHTVNKAYDLLRREGLIRLGRRTGAVVHRGPENGPPDPHMLESWSARSRTLLAEAVAQGMPPEQILHLCHGLLSEFTGASGVTPTGRSGGQDPEGEEASP